MTISIILPTYNGKDKIGNALRSLSRQEQAGVEVIVVIDGSTDGTEDYLRSNDWALKRLKITAQPNAGRAAARNAGARISEGALLVFLDDDMMTGDNWLRAHVEHHRRFPGSLMTGKFEDLFGDSKAEFWRYVRWLDKSWGKSLGDAGSPDAPLKKAYLSAANFSVSRHDFFRLGGFDERLNDAEDLDLARRAVSAGYSIYYKAEAAAVHHDLNISGFREFIKRQRRYSHAHRKLKELHPEYYPSTNGIPRMELLRGGFKRKVFAIFVSGFWIISLERNWWKWLPQKIRFKLYDIIVTANGRIYPDRIPL